MNVLRQILFTFAVVIGLSAAGYAQRDKPKNPPKERPPVVVPGDKKPKEKPPKDERPKKPEMSFLFAAIVKEDQTA